MLRVHPAQKHLAVERARLAGLVANIQRILQRLHLCFVFLQQPQTGPDNIAGGTVATALDLGINKAGEVRPEGN
ncbi:hypothetical protein ADT28_12715 [Xylella fastidiosa]|nr:hypothetical protein XFFB_06170 [Xylella fastidiosa]OCA57470.1 hypothetical protein AA93_08830 [Xylella fastidiosa subsp. pauca 11399]OJZ71493.1 hypothetical protein B375_0204425 [Xylella fastidiosa 6c]KXB18693.1 hypothetical protein ADT28_12715 [Xylella fastidiosa]KXB20455.1 hypothetical protein ADT30_07470 [Xylella fastidiosa]